MEEKNIALLGFITSAAEYLKDQLKEDSEPLKEIKDINLESIKNEISKKLDNSFSDTPKNANDLINAGRDVFKNLINSKPTLIDEFDDIFNVDFKKINEKNEKEVTDHLLDLLKKPVAKENDEVDEYVKKIAENVEPPKYVQPTVKEGEQGMDDIFLEILQHEEEPIVVEEAIEENGPLSERLSNFKYEETPKPVDVVVEPEIKEVVVKEYDPDQLSDSLSSFKYEEPFFISNEIKKEEPNVTIEDVQKDIEEDDSDNLSAFLRNLKNEDFSLNDKEYAERLLNDLSSNHLEEAIEENERLKEIEKQKADGTYVPEEPVLEDKKEDEAQNVELTNEDEYVVQLMNDLSNSKIAEILEQNEKAEKARYAIYESIKEMYPYLNDGFIRGIYDLKESFAEEFKNDQKIIILHRVSFKEVEHLRQFAEIVLQHEYVVNVDEEKMIVDTFKEVINSDGKILNDIFEIANQGKFLSGEYEGYRVLINEEEKEEE